MKLKLNNPYYYIIWSSAKNLSKYILVKYQEFVLAPIISILFFLGYLYKKVYLQNLDQSLTISIYSNYGSKFFIFYLLIPIQTILLLLLCTISINYLTQYFIKKDLFFTPINYKLFTSAIEKTIYILVLPFYLIILITLAIAVDLNFIQSVLIIAACLVFFLLKTTLINRLIIISSPKLSNIFKKHNYHLYFGLINSIFIIFELILIVKFRIQILNQPLWLLLYFCILGIALLILTRSKDIDFLYIYKWDTLIHDKVLKESLVPNFMKYQHLLFIRNYKLFLEYFILTAGALYAVSNIDFFEILDFTNIMIVSACVVSTYLLGLDEYYKIDFKRFPINKLKVKSVIVGYSAVISISLCLIYSYILNINLNIEKLIIFISVLILLCIIQLFIKLKLSTKSSIIFNFLYYIVAYVLTSGLTFLIQNRW